MNNELNILLTSSGRRSYLVNYFKEALNGQGLVHAANSTDISPAFHAADRTVVTPLIYDENYIPFLVSYCKENNIKAIISLLDIDLPILARNRTEFEKIGTKLIVSDSRVIDICNDKWNTYKFLTENSISAPATFLNTEKALDAINTGKISYPVIIKPRWGMGSIAVFEAENEEELRLLYKKAKTKIFKSVLKYESGAHAEDCVIIQEMLSGQEHGMDVMNDLNGIYVNTSVKKKYAMRSGETDCAVTVENANAKALGEKLSKLLGHIGNLDVDVFIDGENITVLEMNARFGGGYPFSHMAGVNMPLAIVKWLRGEKTDKALLTERINIMTHKDIDLVRLQNIPDIRIDTISDKISAFELISRFDCEMHPALASRGIDLEEYAAKLTENGVVLCIYNIDKPVGMLGAYMNDKITHMAFLSFLAVSGEFRGLKLGQKILECAEKMAKNKGMRFFKLEVRKNNYTAIDFYKSLGYELLEDETDTSYYMLKSI